MAEKGHLHVLFFLCRLVTRINKGQFRVDGVEYSLTVNNGDNHLHGGTIGFDKSLWCMGSPPTCDPECCTVRLCLLSRDGDQGYPGDLEVRHG